MKNSIMEQLEDLCDFAGDHLAHARAYIRTHDSADEVLSGLLRARWRIEQAVRVLEKEWE